MLNYVVLCHQNNCLFSYGKLIVLDAFPRPVHWHVSDALKKNTLSDQSLLSRHVF